MGEGKRGRGRDIRWVGMRVRGRGEREGGMGVKGKGEGLCGKGERGKGSESKGKGGTQGHKGNYMAHGNGREKKDEKQGRSQPNHVLPSLPLHSSLSILLFSFFLPFPKSVL